jgi:ribose transport system permease protein
MKASAVIRSGGMVPWLVLLVLVLAASVLSDTFLVQRNIDNVFRQAAALALISIGQTFTVLTAGIDLSVGSVASLSSCLASGMIDGDPANIAQALLVILGIALMIGLFNGLIITKTGVHPLIVTLGMMSVVQGGLLLYTMEPIGSMPEELDFIAWGKVWFLPTAFLLVLFVVVVCLVLLRKTVLGRYIYATGGDESVARLSGIKTDYVKIAVYMICSALAAFTGVFLSLRMGMGEPLVGERYMLDSILPVLIGGTSLTGGKGGVTGTLAGVFIFIILSNLLNHLQVSAYWQWIIKGLIIIIAVSFYWRKNN